MVAEGTLLSQVRAAAKKVETRERELEGARGELRAAILDAHAEGIPIARIAREAGLSRQWVSHLVQSRESH